LQCVTVEVKFGELFAVEQMHLFDIFAFTKCHDLETRVIVHSSLLEMTPFDRLYDYMPVNVQ